MGARFFMLKILPSKRKALIKELIKAFLFI